MNIDDFSKGFLGDSVENHPYYAFIKDYGTAMTSYMSKNPTADVRDVFGLLHEIITTCKNAEKSLLEIDRLAHADAHLAKELEEIHALIRGQKSEEDA